MESFHLTPYRKVLVKNLSGGNRRKLSVAVTCFGSSSNVLMDEPTSDMDPVTRSIVYRSINRLLLENRSVILTSHTITEIDRVCDRIGIMRQGKMIVIAPPQQLKTMYGNRYAVTVYYDQIEALTIERVSDILLQFHFYFYHQFPLEILHAPARHLLISVIFSSNPSLNRILKKY